MNATVSKYVRNCTSGVIAFAVASAVCPVSAFAAESGAGINAILPQMEEFIPMLVAFIILWIVLAKFGWPKFEGMLQKREDMIKTNLEKAEVARQESERLLAEYQEQLENAKSQAQAMLTNAQKSSEALETEIKDRARQEADAMIEKAKVAIEQEKRNAMKELQSSMVDTSIDVATRLIGEDFSDAEHRKLIERYVKEAGNLNA
ncbi:MAG: F0F1 ATP synthase subunit B [Eggerthellaceae bacterium]